MYFVLPLRISWREALSVNPCWIPIPFDGLSTRMSCSRHLPLILFPALGVLAPLLDFHSGLDIKRVTSCQPSDNRLDNPILSCGGNTALCLTSPLLLTKCAKPVVVGNFAPKEVVNQPLLFKRAERPKKGDSCILSRTHLCGFFGTTPWSSPPTWSAYWGPTILRILCNALFLAEK